MFKTLKFVFHLSTIYEFVWLFKKDSKRGKETTGNFFWLLPKVVIDFDTVFPPEWPSRQILDHQSLSQGFWGVLFPVGPFSTPCWTPLRRSGPPRFGPSLATATRKQDFATKHKSKNVQHLKLHGWGHFSHHLQQHRHVRGLHSVQLFGHVRPTAFGKQNFDMTHNRKVV